MARSHALASHMSVHDRIVAAIAVTAVVAGLAGAFAVVELRRTTSEFVEHVDVAHHAALEASRLHSAFQLQHHEWKNILIRGADPATFEARKVAVQAAAHTVLTTESELRDGLARLNTSQGDALLRSFDSSYAVYMSTYTDALQALDGSSGFEQAAGDAVMQQKDRPVSQVLVALAELLAHEADRTAAEAAASARRGVWLVLVAVCGTLLAAGVGLWVVHRFGRAIEIESRRAGVLNRFTEVTSFAVDDSTVAASNLEALALLVQPDGAVTHVLNRSKDRAVPEANRGDAVAEVLTLNALSHCPGAVRGAMHVTDDVQAPLSVHCPAYPVSEGTVACIPLSSGEWVGTVHLHWTRPNALPLAVRPSVVRVAEHAALAIANRRLLATLQRQANTDARTGLANIRAFDEAVESALSARAIDESVAVFMLDLDHFKDFNDRHGHPAGDDALRTFAGILRSCMREGDLAARYGGEEFAVLLRGIESGGAWAVAERIRAQTELTVLTLAPGLTDHITVSIGVALAPDQGTERAALLRLADEALYRAKAGGRNRVSMVDGPAPIRVAQQLATTAREDTAA